MAPLWAVFEPEWYRLHYRDAPDGSAEDLLEWHLVRGQGLGYSPNRFFDEMWQRRNWPGIAELIDAGSVASAFDAWCAGPHATRAPHWLFDPREYRTRYPALTDEVLAETGFVNRYDHYLRFGAAEGRVGHALFDPAVYLAELDPADAQAAAAMPFLHYLRGLESHAPERRTSFLFDPVWYGDAYPQAAAAVRSNQYRSLLEHYLCNDTPTEFNPLPWFSEEFYLTENPGLAAAIGPDGFRNGYAHFLAFGRDEGRSPHPGLAWYASLHEVRSDIESGRAPDAFAHLITFGRPAGRFGRPAPAEALSSEQAIAFYRQRVEAIAPVLGRRKLDFSLDGPPELSVIMTVREDVPATLTSLISLRSHYGGGIELILIVAGDATATGLTAGMELASMVTGATILRFGISLDDAAARAAGLVCAKADAVVFLGEGLDLAPGAIDATLSRLASDAAIGAVGGRLIQPDGALREAGGIIWRDGRIQSYAQGASAQTPEANFVRDADFCSGCFLVARRDVLGSLPEQAAGLAGTTHDAADLCTRIRQSGFRVVYDPDVVVFLTSPPRQTEPDGQEAFISAHGAWLATRPAFGPAAMLDARSAGPTRTKVLMIEDTVPLRAIGSGFVRSNDVVRAMALSGAAVTLFPLNPNRFPLPAIRADLPDTVEVIHDRGIAGFADFAAERQGFYDLVWVGRTHNLDLTHEVLESLLRTENAPSRAVATIVPEALALDWTSGGLSVSGTEPPFDGVPPEPISRYESSVSEVTLAADSVTPVHDLASTEYWARIVLDTEAVRSVRDAERAALLRQPFDLSQALRHEFRHLKPSMRVIAVNAAEAAIVQAHHGGHVWVLGHGVPPSPTPRGHGERSGILFAGAIHAMDHPNYDGLVWFVEEVLPIIDDALRWETRLTVAGYLAPGVTLDRFKGHPRVTLRGAVADLRPLYESNRVFVAPARFAAGIPYKVHEAAAFGLPVVATSLLATQLGWADGDAIGAADMADPAGFAARVIALHRDAPLWTRIREAALSRVKADLDPAAFASAVAEIIRQS